MKYTELFSPHHLATLVDWLEEKGQLLLQIELPHSGGSGVCHTVQSLAELKVLIEGVTHPEIEIVIWKNMTQSAFESDELLPDLKWIYGHTDEVMYLAVLKNRNFSFSYSDHAARYEKAISDWFGHG